MGGGPAPEYPILVEVLDSLNATVMGCNACGRQTLVEDPELFMVVSEIGACPHCDAVAAYVPAYERGTRCPGCGVMAVFQPVDGHCSRVCLLQAQYAQTLEDRDG